MGADAGGGCLDAVQAIERQFLTGVINTLLNTSDDCWFQKLICIA